MAKIPRYQGDLEAFSSSATGQERVIFGDTGATQSDDLTDNINSDFLRGWGALALGNKPPREWFNSVHFVSTQLSAYLHQMGVAEWHVDQEYFTGSKVTHKGITWELKATSDVGTEPATGDTWGQASIPLVAHIKQLSGVPLIDKVLYRTESFYSGLNVGGGDFIYDETKNKAEHNGITIIDPDRLAAWNGTLADLPTYYTDGTGAGCFVRVNYDRINILWAGATGLDADNQQVAIDNFIAVWMPQQKPGYIPQGVYNSTGRILFGIAANQNRRMPALIGEGPYSSTFKSTSTITPSISFFGSAAGPDHYQGYIERVGFTCDTPNVAVAFGLDNLTDNLGNFTVRQCFFGNPNSTSDAGAVSLELNWLFDCTFENIVAVGRPNVGKALSMRQTHFCTFNGGSYSNAEFGIFFENDGQCYSTTFLSPDLENVTKGIATDNAAIDEYITFINSFIDVRDPVADDEPVGGYMFDIQSANTGGYVFDGVRPARLYSAIYGGNAFSPTTNHAYVKLNGRYGGQTTPALPASDTPELNNTGQTQRVRVWGGTVTDIFINGNQLTGVTDGEFVLDPGETIAVRYSAAPSWEWKALA